MILRIRVFAAMFFAVCVLTLAPRHARADDKKPEKPEKPEKKEAWYDRIQIGGYTQVRYNRIGASNPELKSPHDRSIGDGGGFLIRRARLRIQGDVFPFLSIYLQPDFATIPTEGVTHVGQIRDWYADIYLDRRKEFRFRVGQSKVPYGFENMQSSQNRLAFDRTDGLNTAVRDERDLGVFFYWAPDTVRKRFKHLVDSGLKGSGDYGMTAIGVFNGQGANQPERNDNKHFIARLAYPMEIGNQILELDVGGYTGIFNVKKAEGIGGPSDVRDLRMHASVILYPQPIGFQAEYNIGRGPELVGKTVEERPLAGGYAMTMVKIGHFMPYVRALHYQGGRKVETSAPRHVVRELEAGIEWQPWKALEITAAYSEMVRKVNGTEQDGRMLRLQLQFNY